LCCTL